MCYRLFSELVNLPLKRLAIMEGVEILAIVAIFAMVIISLWPNEPD